MYNDWIYKERRRELRRKETEAETALWQNLRNRRFSGLKFFRQYSFGPYIIDFYCPKLRLAVELDGSQHLGPANMEYDIERTRFLNDKRVVVLRFWNDEVFKKRENVLLRVAQAVENVPAADPAATTPPPFGHLPFSKGEASPLC